MIDTLKDLVMPHIKSIISKYVSPDQADEAEAAIINSLSQVDIAQIQVNKAEAAGNWIQRGWRPFTGWSCALTVFYAGIFQPIANGLLSVFGFVEIFPDVDLAVTLPLLMGMLGLSSLRSYEKLKGINTR